MLWFKRKKAASSVKKIDEDEAEIEKQIKLANRMIKLREKELQLAEIEADYDDLMDDIYGPEDNNPIANFENMISSKLMNSFNEPQQQNMSNNPQSLSHDEIDSILKDIPKRVLKQIPNMSDESLATHIGNFAPNMQPQAINEAVTYIRSRKF